MTNPPLIQIPQDARAFYDSIMAKIEPDLTTSELPRLAARYRDESIEDLKIRGRRYFQAFQKFREALAANVNELGEKADALNDFVRKVLEQLSISQDSENLDHLQTAIQSS